VEILDEKLKLPERPMIPIGTNAPAVRPPPR
jgi:hypothetical protein